MAANMPTTDSGEKKTLQENTHPQGLLIKSPFSAHIYF